MARKPTDSVQLKVRMPEHLRKKIEAQAAKYDRTLNAEIVRRLEESFDQARMLADIKGTVESTFAFIVKQGSEDKK
jgi:Arc-like DNA binding domain